MKTTIEHLNPTAEDKEKAQELDDVYPHGSMLKIGDIRYARINGAITNLEQFLEAQRDEIYRQIQIPTNNGIVSICANCEKEKDPRHALVKWFTKLGIPVSHGICQRHFDEEIAKLQM